MALTSALIVDDSKLARITLRKKLEKIGFTVALAESAEQAFSMLEDHCPDIIFMDHLMPDMDGFEATQKLRAMPAYETLPIVMCSGKDHEGYLEEAQAIGANFTLIKPPTTEALDEIMHMDFTAVEAGSEETYELSDTPDISDASEIAASSLIEEMDDLSAADIMDEIEIGPVVEESVLAEDPLGLGLVDEAHIETAADAVESEIDMTDELDALSIEANEVEEVTAAEKDMALAIEPEDTPAVIKASLSSLDIEGLIDSKVSDLLAQQQVDLVQQVQMQMSQTEPKAMDESTIQLLVEASLNAKLPQITQQLSSELMPQIKALIDQRLTEVDHASTEPAADHASLIEQLTRQLASTAQDLLDLQQQFNAFKMQDDALIDRALTALKPAA